MFRRALTFCLLCLACPLWAAPLRMDLGQGLSYFRVHQVPADLPAASDSSPRHASVLDLRYVKGGRAAAQSLELWLKIHCALRNPVILLANSGTSPALLAPYGSADAVAGLLIVGPDLANFAVDVAIPPQSGPAERQAYDALETGTPISVLLDDNPPKTRNDEARLARDHITDAEMADEPPPPAAAPATRPLVDTALLQAVRLYRALVALKRI